MNLAYYLTASAVLFGIGLFGLLLRRNLVAMLIALELMLASVSVAVVALTMHEGDDASVGIVVALVIAGVAAAESAIALSLFVAIQRSTQHIDVEQLSELKG